MSGHEKLSEPPGDSVTVIRRRITVVTGGATPERRVALAGAGQVVAALRRLGHQVTVVDTGNGTLDGEGERRLLAGAVGAAPPRRSELEVLASREDRIGLLSSSAFVEADLLFLVLHGRDGEGGSLQALLEAKGLRYTGSDSIGSVLAMDKDISKRLLRFGGVPTPDWWMWPLADRELERLEYPVVVKPSRVGSTVGLSVARTAAQVGIAVEEALGYDSEVLVEAFLHGRELTVGVLGDRALGVGEIASPGEVFDYRSKYTPGVAVETFPAAIPEALSDEVRALALEVHRLLKLRDFSRVDFRLDRDSRPFCLEANTLPGLTTTSLLPQSAAVAGIDFDGLCQEIVDLTLARDVTAT